MFLRIKQFCERWSFIVVMVATRKKEGIVKRICGKWIQRKDRVSVDTRHWCIRRESRSVAIEIKIWTRLIATLQIAIENIVLSVIDLSLIHIFHTLFWPSILIQYSLIISSFTTITFGIDFKQLKHNNYLILNLVFRIIPFLYWLLTVTSKKHFTI